jgi:hypothetical protein
VLVRCVCAPDRPWLPPTSSTTAWKESVKLSLASLLSPATTVAPLQEKVMSWPLASTPEPDGVTARAGNEPLKLPVSATAEPWT